METSNFYSRESAEDLEYLMESFKPGKYFVERKSDNKWLMPFCNPDNASEQDWTNDPTKAMSWRTKPLAELEIIRMKLGDSCIVTEHEFIDKPSAPTEDKKAPVDAETFLQSKDIWHHPMVMDRNHKNGFEIADLLTEFGSQERNRAIQECIDLMSKEVSFGYIEYQWHALKERLENLKK